MVTVEVTHEENVEISFSQQQLEQTAQAVCDRLGNSQDLLVSVKFVSLETMRQLNRDYHDIDKPTDVLSFPYLDDFSQVPNNVDFSSTRRSGGYYSW